MGVGKGLMAVGVLVVVAVWVECVTCVRRVMCVSYV